LIPTLREDPSEAEAISHKLLLRGGYIRRLAAGLYIFLPLGWRVINKINNIIRKEMNAIGALEIHMPALHPAEIWQQTGRWSEIGDEMFRLKDRNGRDMCLGMTHEEIITWLAAHEIRSYRDLPLFLYQIQTKFRDEARPRGGILRTREFLMKDSYSFDVDEEGLNTSYDLHIEAYCRIFNECGLAFYTAESDPGMMGGFTAHEFMSPSVDGEDEIILCDKCGYVANVEVGMTFSPDIEDRDWDFEEVYTGDKKSIEEVSTFLNIPPSYLIKSLLMVGEKGPFLVLLRGDQELHEKKLQRIIGRFRPAHKDEVKEILGVEPGYIGPVGKEIPIYADLSLQKGTYIAGANKEGFHIKGVKPGVHFDANWYDLHVSRDGELCSKCRAEVHIQKAIEIGNTFRLGTKYSKPLKAFYLDREGKEKPIVMGSYGIGPARVAAAIVEQYHDDRGIIWPPSISPFDFIILVLNNKDEECVEAGEKLYKSLEKEGFEVLIDDRDERPGVKFNDADLIGIPWQLIIGSKSIKEGCVELKSRLSGEIEKIQIESSIDKIKGCIKT
ncbi:MAG: proline--tRNA ligase, partial [Nitrospirae bacterium]